jgi:hypothetical protein
MNGGGPGMRKYGIAAVLLGLYAAVASWIVSGEGQSYRDQLAQRTTDSGPKLAVGLKPAVKPVAPEPEPTPAPEPSPTPVVATAEPKPNRPAPPVERPASPPVANKVEGPKLDPFWNEPDQQKIWDFDKFTAADERTLGKTLNKMVLKDHAELDQGTLVRRMEEAAKPYLAAVTRKDVEYTFTVLDCPRLNAFSHPGGYIYVCKGLFDWIAEDEDYALGFILGHEIAHVDLGHAVTCMRDPEIKEKFKFGTSLFFYAALLPGGYLPTQEQEADRWVVTRMMKDGKTRYQILAFLRRLEDYAKSNGFENKKKAPTDEPRVPLLDNHIRTHPIPRKRLEEARAFIDKFPKT